MDTLGIVGGLFGINLVLFSGVLYLHSIRRELFKIKQLMEAREKRDAGSD